MSIPPPSRSSFSASRREGLAAVRARLERARNVVLTTHVNPDGDGVGCEVALAHFLGRRGIGATLVNPSPVPDSLRFLLKGVEAATPGQRAGARALEAADLIAVLDTAEEGRLGPIARRLATTPGVLIDHHPPVGPPITEPAVRDPTACATGELVFDMLTLDGGAIGDREATPLYVAIVTDTGSFRFSNTTARTHEIAARLVAAGADPGALYGDLFGQYTEPRLRLLRRTLETLEVDDDLPIAWTVLDAAALRDSGAKAEDTDGLVEFPRRLRGIEVALAFRELSADRTKVSLRSTGDVDVARIAQSLGGGGHEKAAGVVVAEPLRAAIETVLRQARDAVRVHAAQASRAEPPG